MNRDWLTMLAALSGAVAIAAGAFAAHRATPEARELLRTGALYQLVHAVAVVAVAGRGPVAPWLMLAGSALFALTLYALAFGSPRWLGAVTPVGGVAMIAGWLVLAWRARLA